MDKEGLTQQNCSIEKTNSCDIDMKLRTKNDLVVETVRKRISTGGLGRGERLPSIRTLAAQLCVSSSTVSEAYDRLVAEGSVTARPGAGYYVNDVSVHPEVARMRRDHAIDPFWVSRQALETDPTVWQPGCGWLPGAWMPRALLETALRDAARSPETVLTGYGPAMGAPGVRALISRRWAESQLYVSPEQILLTGSGTQALDLVCRILLKSGDCVLIDDPCYFNFRALLTVHGVRIVSVPFTPEGPDLAVFAEILSRERPRLYLTNSGLQNPTGGTLSLKNAHAVLMLARQCGTYVIEDDIFADFAPPPSASFAPLDGLDRVVRIGSFSKTLTASLRCGYIAAHPDLIEALVDLQIATGFAGVSPLAAQIVQHVIESGAYRRHMDALNTKLSRARRDCISRLAALGVQPWIIPKGGFSLWCAVPDRCDASRLAQLALKEGMLLAPGAVFSDSLQAARFMRFNVAQMGDPEIFRRLAALIERTRESWQEYQPSPGASFSRNGDTGR